MSPRRCFLLLAIAAAAIGLAASPSLAQLNTQHIKGSLGVKAGSQAPPGAYAIAPLLYFYSTDDIRTATGKQLPLNASIDAALFGAGVSVVTKKQIFGGQYGFTVVVPGANNRLQGAEIDKNPGAGLTDAAVTPLQLGWHHQGADALVYYTLYMPTGRYEDGASNNTGLGMWGQEVGAGTTVYLTPDHKYHAATTMSLVFSSKKKDSETKPGTQMNFEGGVGGDFLKGGLVAGLAYYSSFKVTNDQIDLAALPQPLALGKSTVFALGPDVMLALAKANTVYGFLNVRYFWEVHAKTTTKGGAWLITATFPFHPIKLPTP